MLAKAFPRLQWSPAMSAEYQLSLLPRSIRDGSEIPDAKLAALSTFARVMVTTRGLPARRDVDTFLSAGFSERQVLEIILAIAVKTLSNYSNHLFHTPVDAMFASRTWSP